MTSLELVPAFAALEKSGALKPTSLELDPSISYENYERLGVMLTFLAQANRWWLVDWLVFGEGVFSDRVDQAIAATGLSERRVRNLRAIGMSVPPSRRVLELSVDWHAEVAAMKPGDQRRWLSRAKKEKASNPGFTQRELRELIREEQVARGEDPPAQRTRSREPIREPQPAMKDGYVVKGALLRRLVHEAVGTGDNWCRVPREVVNQIAVVIGADPL